MPRPLKYLPGARIESIGDLAEEIAARRYVIAWRGTSPPVGRQGQRIHPGWVASWQFNMAMNAVRNGHLYRAVFNPELTHNKESSE